MRRTDTLILPLAAILNNSFAEIDRKINIDIKASDVCHGTGQASINVRDAGSRN